MKHTVTEEFVDLCKAIVAESKSESDWALIESDDMFQSGPYEGGFDADEAEFCFGVVINGDEFWFQISLKQVSEIANETSRTVDVRLAE